MPGLRNNHDDPTAGLGDKVQAALAAHRPLTAAEQRAKTEAAIKKALNGPKGKKGGARSKRKHLSKRRTHKRK